MPAPDPNFATELLGEPCLVCLEDFGGENIVVIYYDTCHKIHPAHYHCHVEWSKTVFQRDGEFSCHYCRQTWTRVHSVILLADGSDPPPSPLTCEKCGIMSLSNEFSHLDYEELDESAEYSLVRMRLCAVCAMVKNRPVSSGFREEGEGEGDEDLEAFRLG